jgi:flagellar hook-associated protein 1 FlgK
MSAARINMEDRLAFESARWETLREKELTYGVDSDQEMQTLMQIEQAYSANARVIQTLDSMIRTLMEI